MIVGTDEGSPKFKIITTSGQCDSNMWLSLAIPSSQSDRSEWTVGKVLKIVVEMKGSRMGITEIEIDSG